MNEKREKLNTSAYSRAPERTIEKESYLLSFAEIPTTTDSIERELTSLSFEENELPVVRFETETERAPEKLNVKERARYAANGAWWSVATLLAFGLNSVVLFLDGGLLNILFTTTGYLAYKQFNAAITGTAHACLKFVCTLETVKKNVSAIFTAIKDKLTGKVSYLDCVGCTA